MKAGTLAAVGTVLTLLTRNPKRVPLGTCRDAKTGQARTPRPPCDKNGRGPYIGPGRDGKPMHQPCDKPGDCKPVTVADPVTSTLHSIGLLCIGAAALMTIAKDAR